MPTQNPYREIGELQDLSPRTEIAMSPQRVEQYLLMVQFLLDVISPEGYAHEMPQEVIRRASRILKQSPVELPYLPPALPVSEFAEPVHESDA
jgi:hypothetical protein